MEKLSPQSAWTKYLMKPSLSQQGWLEDSKKISDYTESTVFKISKRELFSLILLAYIQNDSSSSKNWKVDYDPSISDPNDGVITNGEKTIVVENKIVTQFLTDNVLEAILSTYEKFRKKGKAYGKGRVLAIHCNAATQPIKTSDLHKKIAEEGNCPFDRVLLINAIANKGTIVVMKVTEHFPERFQAQVDLDITTGKADVPYNTFSSL